MRFKHPLKDLNRALSDGLRDRQHPDHGRTEMLITSATNSILHTLNSDRETGAHERGLQPRFGVAILRALQVLARVITQRFTTGSQQNGSRPLAANR